MRITKLIMIAMVFGQFIFSSVAKAQITPEMLKAEMLSAVRSRSNFKLHYSATDLRAVADKQTFNKMSVEVLNFVIENHWFEGCRILLNNSVDINMPTSGSTALDLAVNRLVLELGDHKTSQADINQGVLIVLDLLLSRGRISNPSLFGALSSIIGALDVIYKPEIGINPWFTVSNILPQLKGLGSTDARFENPELVKKFVMERFTKTMDEYMKGRK